MDNEVSHKYADSFNEFISDTREALCNPYLKFFVYQINRRIAEKEEHSENWSVVRDALRRAGHGDNVYTVPSFGAELMEDGLHNSPSGCDLIGSRMAGVILSALYNKRVSSNIPDEQKAEKTSEKEITVYFNDETCFASKSSTGGEFDFKVTDAEGEIEICEITLDVNKVIIKTARPVRGKATVYGAYGANPKKHIPYYYISKNPMLGFIAEA